MQKIWSFLLSLSVLYAQENQLVADSVILLDAVDVLKNEVFSAGHVVQEFNTGDVLWKTNQTIGEALSKTTAIPFRNYGNGMLSTLSVRGLSPSHTGIFWEGLPLNSILNGQTDLNLYGTQTFDELTFRRGGGSALFGSGAIGGSIHLGNRKNFNKGLNLELLQTIGSFGLSNSNLKLDWGNEKWSVNTAAQYLTVENDYEITTTSGNEQRLDNAAVQLANVQAQIAYKLDDKNQLKLSAWQTYGDRDLPGTRGVPNSNQNQKDQSTRLSLQYERQSKHTKNTFQFAYLNEDFEYQLNQNLSDVSESKANNWIGKYDFLWNLSKGWRLNSGVLAQFADAEGSNYNNPSRTDWTFFVAFNKRFSRKLNTSLTVHKGISNQYNIPFTFDLGADYQLNKKHQVKANFSTNYRTPTFNDLFWQGLGNPDLEPESSWVAEAAYEFKTKGKVEFNFLANLFYGDFDNWIQWLPDVSGTFRPINVYEVENYGVESQIELQKQWQNFGANLFAAYQYVQSKNKETGNQLIYTPEHSLNSNVTFNYKKWGLMYSVSYISKSYNTRDESQYLDPFTVSDISLFSSFKLFKTLVFINFGINNLFDEDYETIRGYEFPGINYDLTIQIKFKNK